MNIKEYEVMEKYEKTFWWHQGRLHLIEHLLNTYFPEKTHGKLNIFEIGCGTGEVTRFLQKYGTTTGVDMSDLAIKFCKDKGLKNVFKEDIVSMDTEKHKKKYDVVFALDVLEHIQDDVEALKNTRKILKKDGLFIATVPAYKFLWSEHDEALHHKRRYHSIELIKKFEDAKFKIEKKSHFVFVAFLPIAIFKLLGSVFGRSPYPKTSYINLPKHLNNAMIATLKLESKLLTKFPLPVGTTIVVVAKPL